jgi:hypothetical protein
MWLHIRASFFASIRRIRTRIGWAIAFAKAANSSSAAGPSTAVARRSTGCSSGGQQAAVSGSRALTSEMVLLFIVNRRLTIAQPSETAELFSKGLQMSFRQAQFLTFGRCPRRPASKHAGRQTYECVAQISGCTRSMPSTSAMSAAPDTQPAYACKLLRRPCTAGTSACCAEDAAAKSNGATGCGCGSAARRDAPTTACSKHADELCKTFESLMST